MTRLEKIQNLIQEISFFSWKHSKNPDKQLPNFLVKLSKFLKDELSKESIQTKEKGE